jgi:signal transduction histidine kinase
MSFLPIRLRLTLAFALAMAVVLAVVGVFLYQRVGASSVGAVDASLHVQAAESLGRIARPDEHHDLVDEDARAGSIVAELLDGRGAVLRASPSGLAPFLSRQDVSRVLGGAVLLRTSAIPGLGRDWRLYAERVPGRDGILAVARSLESRNEALHGLFREFLVVGPLALLLASLAGYGLAAAALRPVEAMRRRAAAVSAQTPGRRLPVPRARDEVSRLAETLNEMLARLEASFAHERRFVADASHELRTPLSLLRTELELALRRPRTRGELEEALRSAAEDTQRLTRLAEDLLLLAGADRNGLPVRRGPVDAGALLERVRERFAARADAEGRPAVAAPTEGVLLDADEDRLEQALANLLENSLRHGAGPVALSVREVRGLAELHVEDEGPGFPAEFLPRAFDRFARADAARSGGGTGLGLSIVQLIAVAHGGEAGVANRPSGGADAWIAVPLAPAGDPVPAGRAPVAAA